MGRQKGNEDILAFVDSKGPGLLVLAQGKPLHLEPEQAGLELFPGPAHGPLGPGQFDLLHALNQLHQRTLVFSRYIEPLEIQLAPLPQK